MNLAFLYESRYVRPELLRTFQDCTLSTAPGRCSLLLRWGNMQGSDQGAEIVLNRKQSLKNCFDQEKAFKIFKANRIRHPRFVAPKPEAQFPMIGKWLEATTGMPKEELIVSLAAAQKSKAAFFVEVLNTVKKYNIYIFDMNIFFVTKKMTVRTHVGGQILHTWEYEEIPPDLDQDSRKACALAQRAAYILGLDFSMVHAGIDARGRPVILDISPVPDFPPKALQLFRQHLKNFVEHHQRTGPQADVLLGADPEFMLRDSRSGSMVFPSAYLDKEGPLGYDERSEHREGRYFPLAEVRPKPNYCPLQLTENIAKILRQAVNRLPPHLEWLAGSQPFDRYQIGGHIHFSSIIVSSRLIRALDNYLAIPMMLIEDPETSAKRRRHYGWLGSIRTKPHGGFEYRTPGSWLVSPEVTKACLCLAKLVVTHYRSLNKDYFMDLELQKAFYQGRKYLFYDLFEEIWADITKTPLYEQYAPYLAPMVNTIRSNGHWDEQIDLRRAWGLL